MSCHGKEICPISVPQALECFFESTDFEDCLRNCISKGGTHVQTRSNYDDYI